MPNRICDNIFCFPITLPRSPLKYLNCYVVKSSAGKNLLIDTGYALPESRHDLDAGMRELELKPENTDIFLTHIHADHTGNAAYLAKLGYRIIMGERDYCGVISSHSPDFYGAKQKSADAGVPSSVLDSMFVHNPSPIMLPEIFPADTVNAGAVLEYGGHRLECLPTYGHSPGHISLYDRKNGLIFLGDHVLFDISPNIVLWTREDDALGEYLNSLRFVQILPIKIALPAHRTAGNISLAARAEELIAHHKHRLEELTAILCREPGLTCYEAAERMTWSIRAASWDDFPPTQKYFAVCECMAHLQHMYCIGLINRSPGADGIMRYYVAAKEEL